MLIKQQLKIGLLWSSIDSIVLKGFTLFILIWLTRLLTPEDFGLVSIISIFIVIGNAFVDGGMCNSIIRDNSSNVSDYTSVFYGNILISILLYGLLFFIAPLISIYFEDYRLVSLIRIYGISLILSAFFNIQQSVLVKDLKFKEVAMYNLPAIILGSIIGVLLAYLGFGVWSLVWMQLCILFIKTITYWVKSEWLPEQYFSYKKFKKHFLFGYKLMVSSLLDSIMKEVYSFVIGKNFSVNTLGYFSQAKALRGYPVSLISNITSKVTYPLLSRIQENKKKVSKAYSTILKSIFFVICPIMFCLMIVAKPLTLILFTEKWLPVVPYFQILVISGMLIPIHSFNINVFKIYDRTDLFLKLEIVKIVMTSISIFIGIYFGIFGLLIAMTITSFVSLFVNTFYSSKLIDYSTIDQLKDMLPIFSIGIIVSTLTYFLTKLIEDYHSLVVLLISTLFFSISYIVLSYYLNRNSLLEIRTLFFGLMNKKS